ncbi:hypothetical protein F2Q69_00019604 [Brassica cretica]|uniref:Uncharacterized protein n=1 Tax=Brassica cretica TaxID=69181 RepID=A0A8S9Q4V1_BRACR|nr:hypothetical protein F2Q69_00019604 [Brassica cretica]
MAGMLEFWRSLSKQSNPSTLTAADLIPNFTRPQPPRLTRDGDGINGDSEGETRPGRESDSDPEDLEHAEKLRQVKAVLEDGENFSGIYMKVQLKPLKWNGEGEEERPVEALMILKYGGVLTHAGRRAW